MTVNQIHIRTYIHINMFKSIKNGLHSWAFCEAADCVLIIYLCCFQGETSSGKSTLINQLIGEEILPIAVTASTTKVCRVRYSKNFVLSTKTKDDRLIKRWTFRSKEELANNLATLAVTDKKEVFFVDIWMPAEIIKVNELSSFIKSSFFLILT